ncbi:MAG: cob(I)yrinic acid a,c-diamide adenosyltransferase [Bacteroidia bacterium]|nr:cob(I)yrinic acid a,c-diamide adenosyltransferase [Bacteroidia bacterium]
MKVYTKKGDLGKTSILGQTNVDKDDLRIIAYGTVDELNSVVGHVSSLTTNKDLIDQLETIQNTLFSLGSELASMPDVFEKLKLEQVGEKEITALEVWIDDQTGLLPPLKSFVLPGGCQGNAVAHQARTVCRRAERKCVTLAKHIDLRPEVIQYLNRLSDYFFTVARTLSRLENVPEIEWKPRA